MNKELINRYKAEFEHILQDGKLLGKKTESDNWEDLRLEVFTSKMDWHSIIIDDEYFIFRKALSEGKTIQLYDVIEQHISNPNLDEYGWRDFKSCTQSSAFSESVDSYRIKPNEPKFKIGDFVIRKNFNETYRCINIREDLADLQAGTRQITIGIEHLILWQPKPNEWCWFWDHNSDIYASITQFKELHNNKFRSTNYIWNYCAPFIGELPPHLKD
jgi:hypothetical protein